MRFVPTKRLAAFAAGATAIAVGVALVPPLRAPLFALDAALVVAALVDLLFVVGRRVEMEREVGAIFSVGRPNLVTITLRNKSGRRLRGLAVDDPVIDATSTGIPARFDLAPHGAAVLRYEVVPTRRGPRDLRAVTVRYGSVLGLVARQERTELPARVDVYPDVHAARSLELLRRQGRQDAAIGSLRVRGGDTEFERLRPYQRGDEVRHVDWRASARRDDLTVRQFQAESNQNVVFAIDVGRGMLGETRALATATGTGDALAAGHGLTAVDHALNAALLAADVALRGGDKAGLMVFDDAPRTFLPPSGGRAGARKLTRAVYALEPSFGASDYRTAMAFLRAHVKNRALFIIFTNLLDPRSAKELASSLRGLLPRHLPLCVLMRDTDVDALAARPIEDERDVYVRAAAAEALAWRDALVRQLKSFGVLVLDARPSDVTPRLVKSYLEIKARRLL